MVKKISKLVIGILFFCLVAISIYEIVFGYFSQSVNPTCAFTFNGSSITRVKCSWNAISGATRYEVYKSGTIIKTISESDIDFSGNPVTTEFEIPCNDSTTIVFTIKACDSNSCTSGTYDYMTPRCESNTTASCNDDILYGCFNGSLINNTFDGSAYHWYCQGAEINSTQCSYEVPIPNLTCVARSKTSIYCNWGTINKAVRYDLQRDSGIIQNSSAISKTDDNLTCGTTYNYRIRACEEGDICSGWNETSATTTVCAPSTPSSLSCLAASTVSANSIYCHWEEVAGATTYELQRDSATIQNSSAISKTDDNLTCGTTYSYQVKACNEGGCSGWKKTTGLITCPVVGVCGTAHLQSFASLTSSSSNLCSVGAVSNFSGTGPWIWTCSNNGAVSNTCTAYKTTASASGSCGSSNGQSFASAPTTNLCSTGESVNFSGTGPWTWTCSNNGAVSNTCTAYKTTASASGSCGSSNGQSFASLTSSSSNLCSVGIVSNFLENGLWTWNCINSNSDISVPCYANKKQVIDGICGLASNTSSAVAPTANLCSSGTASKVSGTGPWTWNCYGSGGGIDAKCKAAKVSCLWSCSDWSICNNGKQIKTCSSSPADCVGENPNQTSRSCEILQNCVYEFSNYGDCINGKKRRSITNKKPENCIDNLTEPLEQNCVIDSICNYNYSEWGECINGIRKRTVTSTYPDNCIPGTSIIQESCNSEQLYCTEDKWRCEEWNSCNDSKQTRKCYLDFDCLAIKNNAPELTRQCSSASTSSGVSSTSPVQVPVETNEDGQISGELSQQCIEAGIKNINECRVYISQMNIVNECKVNNYLKKDECKQYLLNRYGQPILCSKMGQIQCDTFIDKIILADLKENISAETRNALSGSVGKSAIIDTNNNIITVKEANSGKTEIKINESPLNSSNNNVSVGLVSVKTGKSQSDLSPVGIIFDSNENGIPDDLEKRIDYTKISSDDLTGVDKAIVDGKALEQPKQNSDVSISASLDVNTVDNNENNLRFKGISYPNQVITIFIYSSMPIVVTVKSDENGNWVYDLDKSLVNGKHEVYVAINNDEGKIIEASVPKLFFVAEARAVTMEEFIRIEDASSAKTLEKSDSLIRTYVFVGVGFIFLLLLSFVLIKKIVAGKHE